MCGSRPALILLAVGVATLPAEVEPEAVEVLLESTYIQTEQEVLLTIVM